MLNQEEQRKILRNIITTYSKVLDLEILFWIKGDKPKAIEIQAMGNELDDIIVKLRNTNWSIWEGDAAALEQKIKENNKDLQTAIRDIQNDIQTAQRIVKAIGYIDEVIKVAAGLML